MMERCRACGLAALVAALLAVSGLLQAAAAGYVPDGYARSDPILIVGDSSFYAGNGVTGGKGTADDPYVISTWGITASCSTSCGRGVGRPSVELRNTTAHVVLRDLYLSSGDGYEDCIHLQNVTNATIFSIKSGICGTMVYISDSADIDVTGLDENHSNEWSVMVANSARVRVHHTTFQRFGVYRSSEVDVTGNRITAAGSSSSYQREVDESRSVRIANNEFPGPGGGSLEVHASTDFEISGNRFTGGRGAEIRVETEYWPGMTPDPLWTSPAASSRFSILNNEIINGSITLRGVREATVSGNAGGAENLTLEINDGQALAVAGNALRGGERVAWLGRVEDSAFEYNRVEGSGYGTMLVQGAQNLTVRNNTIKAALRNPIVVEGGSDLRIYHNNILSGREGTAYDYYGNATWDNGYPSGGNFWSQYRGNDSCSGAAQDNCTAGDGVGDEPWSFYNGSMDRYPLKGRAQTDQLPPIPAGAPRTPVGPPGVFTLEGSLGAAALLLLAGAIALVFVATRGGKKRGGLDADDDGRHP